MTTRHAVFVLNQLQDVNVARPLAFMAARHFGMRVEFLLSQKFMLRDRESIWQAELREIGAATGSSSQVFADEAQALDLLRGKAGVLVAASESDDPAHAPSHNVLRLAPAAFLTVTLQHGFECLGFLHNRAHDRRYGPEIVFAADVLCGWSEAGRLSALAPSQRAKLSVTGPSSVLQMPRPGPRQAGPALGLVCENLHSVRLKAAGEAQTDFIRVFDEFCAAQAKEGRSVALRSHPGGQYLLRGTVKLPRNATINNHPMYKVDLTRYAYGISAPSSILIDMVLAGIPVAVWRDPGGEMDTRNYQGLAEISTRSDWLEFSREASAHPQRFLERQRGFLEGLAMPTDPRDVYRRFARVLEPAARPLAPFAGLSRQAERILFVANGLDPSLQLCLLKPLAALTARGDVALQLITEEQMRDKFGKRPDEAAVHAWLGERFAAFGPTLLVFCRYGGPHAAHMLERARAAGAATIYHIDDDLLNIPEQLGAHKFKHHNNPARLATVRLLLDHADLVYCSTGPLMAQFESLGVKAPMRFGRISCSGSVIAPPREGPLRRIGYMGFDHAHDLEVVLGALVPFLRAHPEIEFQLFGAIPRPPALDEFGERVQLLPPVRDYEEFMRAFAQLGWDIGICPLAPTAFNRLKANNKWIEYTSVGAAVIATPGPVYDDCCAGDCGILAGSTEAWLAALEQLAGDSAGRCALVRRAQHKLAGEFSVERQRDQVLEVFADAKSRRALSIISA